VKNGKKIEFEFLTEKEKGIVTRGMMAMISSYLLELIVPLTTQAFQFPHIGLVTFLLFVFKGDSPEKNSWTNSIQCWVCTNEPLLSLSGTYFRTYNSGGRIHPDGFDVSKWGPLCFTGDAWDMFRPMEIMVRY
jgi:hypothetical protein